MKKQQLQQILGFKIYFLTQAVNRLRELIIKKILELKLIQYSI